MKSEFEFINGLKSKYNLSKIGDDAAVLPKDDKTDLVISTDMLVEDIDFRLDWSKPVFVGHKVAVASTSDVYAMGGFPKYSLVSIGIPEKLWKTDFVDRFYDGYLGHGYYLGHNYMGHNVELIGGDISKTPDKVVVDSIVLGEVEKGKAMLRSTAQVGDLIFVNGELGSASAGLKLLENGIRLDDSAATWQVNFLNDQLQPRVAGLDYKFVEFANSMIDISDGLSSDLMHICKASKVGAKIYANKIPVDHRLKRIGKKNFKKFLSENLDKLDFALHGGEEFKLLFTVKPSVFKKYSEKFLSRFHHIGEIAEAPEIIELIRDGESEILEPKGFQHF